MSESLRFQPTSAPFPTTEVPGAVFDRCPEFVEFYDLAWRQAWNHVCDSEHVPHSPYMNEGCFVNRIWIWDSCLMAHFCRYSPAFPTTNTLDNFYDVLNGVSKTGIQVHHPDNPPLFAWTELQLCRMTGDLERVDRLINRDRTLERYFDWFENGDSGELFDWAAMPRLAKRLKNGYMWSALPSGMDNTPRGAGNHYDGILWLDLLAQQGLTALSLVRLAALVGNDRVVRRFQSEYDARKELMQNYWDDEMGAFIDRINAHNAIFSPVLTPASFWPFLAEMGSKEQLQISAEALLDERRLGGKIPFPSVSRSDMAYDPAGGYWRGGIWLPVAYMTVKALEKYDMGSLARQLSEKLLNHMVRTWREFSPHTIWECYNPELPLPSTSKSQKFCRADFCGWSALGPIALLLENLIGLEQLDALTRTISWNSEEQSRCGVRNLRFGSDRVTLIGDCNHLHVECGEPLTVRWHGDSLSCPAGVSDFERHSERI